MPSANRINLTRIVIAFTLFALATACSKSGASSLHVKSADIGEKDTAIKSAYCFGVTKTFTDINNKISTAVTYQSYAANYDLDPTTFALTLDKPMTSDDDIRILFSLVGDEGTNEKSPLKAGTYSAKADKFMKVETVGVVTRKNGRDNKVWFDRAGLTGELKVTSASDDSFSGDIDVASGANSIKGSFTAKILKRK